MRKMIKLSPIVYKSPQHTTHYPHPMPFVTVLATKDLLSAVSSNLDPRHLGNLRLVCKQLAGSIDAAVQAKSVQDALAKYARAVLLPNGAYLLHSRFGVRAVEIRAIPGMQQLMVEANHMNPYGSNPVVSMRLNGASYIGRPWSGTGRDYLMIGNSSTMFSSTATELQGLAGGAWISHLDTSNNFFGDGRLYTVVRLTLDRGNTPSFSGRYQLQLVFTPDGW
jgi:hypothetical protein